MIIIHTVVFSFIETFFEEKTCGEI